jgi:capsular polysaccharide biosynthesis protein
MERPDSTRTALMKRILLLLRMLARWPRRALVEFFRWIGAGTVRLGGPRGLYFALENPREVELVLECQEALPISPHSLRVKCGLNQQGAQPWPIFWTKISHARLVGKSLAVLNEKKQLMVESVFGLRCVPDDDSYHYLSLPRPTRLSGSWTSLISRWCPSGHANYYHWLLDGLPRLALLDRFPAETGILVPGPLQSFQRDSLEILGLLDRCRPSREVHLEIGDYYFSAPTTMTGCDNPYAVRFLRERFLSCAESVPLSFEKIYVSRLGSSRAALQEEAMIDFLSGEGWTIIQAEKYSFREQIAIFSRARAVCGLHGAGLTNLLWCQKGSKVLELCAANFLNGCYEGLAVAAGLDHRYLVFEADRHYRPNVDLQQFASAIRALA